MSIDYKLDVHHNYKEFLENIIINFPPTVKILIVVDEEIGVIPGPMAFGIGRVIDLIRNTTVGIMRFNVTLAVRQNIQTINPTPYEFKYTGFKFDQKESDGKNTIDKFDEIWCFGFKPGNDAGPDSNIALPENLPISDSELNVLTKWMNNHGGIFATGDHDYLGASMCSRIPRVGTMRLWTNADGVPPIGGEDRIDTNRPANAAQADTGGMPEVMPFDNQSDWVPQQIEWVVWAKRFDIRPYVTLIRPHPVLCHPKLGPINVMPDHPHEGRCFDTKEIEIRLRGKPSIFLKEIKLDGTYNFNGYSGDEYPEVDSLRPTPNVIAYGTTLPDPPYIHFKGDSPFKRFPMISIYDGHIVDVGRVIVDSTWHHWLDLNLTEIETSTDKNNWEKIQRYFVNVALWLAPKRISRRIFTYHVLESHFTYLGFREFSIKSNLFENGYPLKRELSRYFGPCWVSDLILEWIKINDKGLYQNILSHYFEIPELKKPKPGPTPCLSCPPLDLLEDVILGGMVIQTIPLIKEIKEQIKINNRFDDSFEMEQFEKQLIQGTSYGLNEISSVLDNSTKYSQKLFKINIVAD